MLPYITMIRWSHSGSLMLRPKILSIFKFCHCPIMFFIILLHSCFQYQIQGHTLHLIVISLSVSVSVVYGCIRIATKLYFKITNIYCLSVSVGQESRYSLLGCLCLKILLKAANCQVGLQSHLKVWLRKDPRSLMWFLQYSVAHGLLDWEPQFFTGCCLEASLCSLPYGLWIE